MNAYWKLILLSSVLLLLAGSWSSLQACPSCSSAVPLERGGIVKADTPQPADYSQGINRSIYFMIAAIYAVLGFFGFIIYRAYKNYQPGLVAPSHGPAQVLHHGALASPSGKETRL